jgi:hypothetical protein
MKFTPIKNTTLHGRNLQGDGYVLASRITLASQTAVFKIEKAGYSDFSFVFAFEGVGNHCRMDVLPSGNLILIHFIRDGIPIYLQHASVEIPADKSIRLHWDSDSIRVDLGFANIINILGEGCPSGHWGFAARDKAYNLPETTVRIAPLTKFQWICLGDGYSNNRWKNRHLFSWPELAFGTTGAHLNACVAAGNTRRALRILESIGHRMSGAVLLIAAGADDLIEGEPIGDYLNRLSLLVELAQSAGAEAIHLCAIPPSTRNNQGIMERNQGILELAGKNDVGFIDFHKTLSPAIPAVLVGGAYPGPEAQRMLAASVIEHLGMKTHLSPLRHIERKPLVHGIAARILSRVEKTIDSMLGKLP